MPEIPSSALDELARRAQERPFDFQALQRQARRRRARRTTTGALLMTLVVAGVLAGFLGALPDGDAVLRQGSSEASPTSGGDGVFLRIVVPDHLEVVEPTDPDGLRRPKMAGGELPDEAEQCLPADAERPEQTSVGTLVRVAGSVEVRRSVIDCLEALEDVQVFEQAGPEVLPVAGLRGESQPLTAEQARRPGVDATQECSVPGVRESAPPFEGEAPIAVAKLVAAYLTDGRGYAKWMYEYHGSIGSGGVVAADELIRICWYEGSGEYQLVSGPVDGSAGSSASGRGPRPFPVLAPPPPRSMSEQELQSRLTTFAQRG